jgi:hypothetical protein
MHEPQIREHVLDLAPLVKAQPPMILYGIL